MIAKEDVIVTLTKDGYIKRTSLRSYQSSNGEQQQLKDGDYIIGLYKLNTLNTVLVFTSLGNYLYIPVHLIPTLVWKDLGKHVSNIVKLDQDEKIVSMIPVTDFDSKEDVTTQGTESNSSDIGSSSSVQRGSGGNNNTTTHPHSNSNGTGTSSSSNSNSNTPDQNSLN